MSRNATGHSKSEAASGALRGGCVPRQPHRPLIEVTETSIELIVVLVDHSPAKQGILSSLYPLLGRIVRFYLDVFNRASSEVEFLRCELAGSHRA